MQFTTLLSQITKTPIKVDEDKVKPSKINGKSQNQPSAGSRTQSLDTRQRPSQDDYIPLGMTEKERQEQLERVRRLKQERLKEREKQAELQKKARSSNKQNSATKTKSSNSGQKQKKSQPSSGNSGTGRSSARPARPAEPSEAEVRPVRPKLKFSELLKQAEQISADKLKLEIKLRDKPKKVEEPRTGSRLAPARRPEPSKSTTKTPSRTADASPSRNIGPITRNPVTRNTAPPPAVPLSKPDPKLLEKLKKKNPQFEEKYRADYGPKAGPKSSIRTEKTRPVNRQKSQKSHKSNQKYSYADEDDYASDDSFIVDDDEVEDVRSASPVDYDRDEIWAMFNRGKKRQDIMRDDLDDDTDDMEATGTEILMEEQRSALRGKLEDKSEEMEEKRRMMEKMKRKKARR